MFLGVVTDDAHTPGRFAQPMADRAQVVEATTILPGFAWRIAKLKYQPPPTVGNVKQGEDSQLAIGAATSVQEGGDPAANQETFITLRHSSHNCRSRIMVWPMILSIVYSMR